MQKQNWIKKGVQIAKAFTSEAPDTDWYQERLKICNACEFNSCNIEGPDSPEITRTKRLAGALGKKCDKVCSACFCCTDEKAKLPESICGLVEIGKTPKWGKVGTSTSTKGFKMKIEVIPSDLGLLFENGKDSEFHVDTNQEVYSLTLKLTGDKITTAKESCICMTIVSLENHEDHQLLHIDVNTHQFKKNVKTHRFITLTCDKKGKTAQFVFNIYTTKR